ncbi:MAG TPA: NADH-quinone oxidoreductase subunit H [Chloroflexi bacterium]|nr:NADH-quinone oxidoreductase subunit H [Chloroflexota bacterium]
MNDLLGSLFALLVFPGLAFLSTCALAFDWLDRRVIARMQGRVGPPWFQPLADLIKLLAKEDILPTGANETVAAVLPMVSLASVLTAALYVPVGGRVAASFEGDLIVVLFLLSIPALAYFLAGWVTVGVYSVLGGNRSLLQYFSYEVPFLMALSTPAILNSSWSIAEISARQLTWGLFTLPLGFILALVGLIGKLKRDPLDIPKAKSEVVAGALTEFSGRKLALWHLAMSMQTVVGIFLLVNLFLGGSKAIFLAVPPPLAPVIFGLKALTILVLLSTFSVLYARLRIDQLARLGWRVLAPLALVQILVTVWMGG